MTFPVFLRPFATFAGVLAFWQGLALAKVAPPYLLPSPLSVAERLWRSHALLLEHGLATLGTALAGLVLGALLGAHAAMLLHRHAAARRWLMPLLISGQAVPVFALAPLLTLWLGFGPTAKIVMTALVVYFPVTAAFYDGLRSVDPRLLALAKVMNARPAATFWRLEVPSALPALGSGLRLAAVFAPISAVIGEWAGAGRGLGYLMLYANSRVAPDLLFAALLLLALLGVALHRLADLIARRLAPWAPLSSL